MALGGVRIYADEPFKVGRKLELDLLLPDARVITCLAEVAWCHDLPEGDVAAYDVGLSFLQLPEGTRNLLSEHVFQPD